MIENTYQLDPAQLKDLTQLKMECKQIDGSVPNFYPHILAQTRSFPVNFLYYEEQKLLGFLSIYFFYDEAVEIAVLVYPPARRNGIAQQLLLKAVPIIQSLNFNNLIFSTPHHVNDKWLKAFGFKYMHSEYCMERDDLNPLLDYNQALSFRQATEQDMLILSALDEACFPKKTSNAQERFQQLFDDRNYQIIIVFQNNQPIGKAHIRWQTQGATLSDIAILPDLQAKGFGSALIAYCVNLALSEGKPYLSLDVETHNQRALNLYVRMGFQVQNACDYWTIDINNLQDKIKLLNNH